MPSLSTYWLYLSDYLRHGHISPVIFGAIYHISGLSYNKTQIIKNRFALFYCRRKTLDYKLANTFYERHVKRYVLEHIDSFDVFLDIGANTGLYSLLLADGHKRVLAFEPLKNNYKVLLINLLLNNKEHKVETFRYGLGDNNEKIDFIERRVNTGASHYYYPDKKGNKTQVIIKRLDDVHKELQLDTTRRFLIKLDVEGMEARVLRGAISFLKEIKQLQLIIEVKHDEESSIKSALFETGDYHFRRIDKYKLLAIKTNES